ncbi:MAG: class I SAM-dependent methyltransferase [Planctomycetota bacterium]
MFENSPHERPACNLCGGESVRLIRGDNFVECTSCRLRFYSPRPTWQALKDRIWNPGNAAGLKKEADSMYEKGVMWGDPPDLASQFAFLANYYRGFLTTIKRYRPDLNSIFEIGGSIGRFLRMAREAFGVPVCDGCEINFEAVKIAKEKMGLPSMVAGDFLSYSPLLNEERLPRTYDCIAALDYIEHTYHPNEDLAKANAMLNPGGVLALKTFLEELDTQRTMVDYPWHSHHFFGDVLYRMVTQNGFSIIHWEVHSENQVFLVARKHEIPADYRSAPSRE